MLEIRLHGPSADDSDKPGYTVTINDGSTFEDFIRNLDTVIKKTEHHSTEEDEDY